MTTDQQNISPADELRQAAALIRATAGKATPGPWVDLYDGDRIVCADGKDGDFVYVVDEPLVSNPANGKHIALWHPGVAVIVADQLTRYADHMEYDAAAIYPEYGAIYLPPTDMWSVRPVRPSEGPQLENMAWTLALRLARAVLGTTR